MRRFVEQLQFECEAIVPFVHSADIQNSMFKYPLCSHCLYSSCFIITLEAILQYRVTVINGHVNLHLQALADSRNTCRLLDVCKT